MKDNNLASNSKAELIYFRDSQGTGNQSRANNPPLQNGALFLSENAEVKKQVIV